jgi:hypothetical protein
MKLFLALIFLPLCSFAQLNKQTLKGLWVKVDAKMKDGSRIVDHDGCGMRFMKFNWNGDGLVAISQGALFDDYKSEYKIIGDTMQIKGLPNNNVLTLANDTLKLFYFMPGVDDSQTPVYYFTKAQEHVIAAEPAYNVDLKDSVYQANNKLFPQCKESTSRLMEEIAIDYNYGTLNASFIVDKKGKYKTSLY